MRIELYPAKDGCRWRLKAGNGKIIAESGEAYSSKSACKKAIKRLQDGWVVWAPLIELREA